MFFENTQECKSILKLLTPVLYAQEIEKKNENQSSIGCLNNRNILKLIFSYLNYEELKVVKTVSKIWNAIVHDPIVLIGSINNHFPISIQKYGCRNYEQLNVFTEKYRNRITSLNLQGFIIDDENLKVLIENCSGVRHLSMRADRLSAKALAGLVNCHELQTIKVSDCTEMTQDVLTSFMKLEKLRSLHISNCYQVTYLWMEELVKLRGLRSLGLSGCVGVFGDLLSVLTNLDQLEELNLEGCNNLQNGVFNVLGILSHLQILNLQKCYQLTKRDLKEFAASSNIQMLYLPKHLDYLRKKRGIFREGVQVFYDVDTSSS